MDTTLLTAPSTGLSVSLEEVAEARFSLGKGLGRGSDGFVIIVELEWVVEEAPRVERSTEKVAGG